MDIIDKTVIITGATGGIGEKLAIEFAKEGSKLILLARTEEKLKKLTDSLQGDGHKYFAFDFTETDKLSKLISEINMETDRVDILINAAGVGVYKALEEVELKEWEESMAINVTAPYFITKKLLPLLKKPEQSAVINIGSGMGKIPTACRSVYCATKFALRGLTMSLADEFRGKDIHFVHMALGSTLTDFGPMDIKDKQEENLKGKAYFTPEWVANKFIEIIKEGKFEDEIILYPSDYNDK
jgi:uncharacterized protein